MPHEVTLDDDVFSDLQQRAEPLVDDINSVLRRLLGSGSGGTPTEARSERPAVSTHDVGRKSRRKAPGRKRAPKGSLLPEERYEIPILRALAERGGRAPSKEIIDAVGDALSDALGPIDHEKLKSGSPRWKSRAQFVRLKLVQIGNMADESPRGTWEITAQGRARLTKAESDE